MKIAIQSLLEGAVRATGTVAVIDVFRAFTTAAVALANGASKIVMVGTVEEALAYAPTTALVGVATAGGRFPPEWRELLKSCIAKGLDLENGLHEFLTGDPELVELARRHGAELRDLRRPPGDLTVATG